MEKAGTATAAADITLNTADSTADEMSKTDLVRRINELREERDAVIVAHYYQNDEVQEIADMVGDSFALAKFCAQSEKSVIVFCGVHFMAESAHILSPDKTVLLPVLTPVARWLKWPRQRA